MGIAPDSAFVYRYLVNSGTMGVGREQEGVFLINLLFDSFMYALRTDYFMFGRVDKLLCKSIASAVKSVGETKVIELMAGAGWLQKGLSEQGLDVYATDDFSIAQSDDYFEPDQAVMVEQWHNITEHMTDFKVIPGASVRKQDAFEALTQSNRKVVILNWPHPNTLLIADILEHCYRTNKMIVYISPEDKNFRNLFADAKEDGDQDHFIDVPETPYSFTKGQQLRIGFWRSVPPWYEIQRERTVARMASRKDTTTQTAWKKVTLLGTLGVLAAASLFYKQGRFTHYANRFYRKR